MRRLAHAAAAVTIIAIAGLFAVAAVLARYADRD